MSELSPQLAAALRGDRPLLVGMVEINLPGYDLLLLDGAAQIMVGNRKFVGRDATYGVLDTIKGLADSLGDKAPAITLGLMPPGTASLAVLLDPSVQGSPCLISVGCVDMRTGLMIPDAYVLTEGELDTATVKWSPNKRTLDFKITGIGERLFATEEGRRMSDAFHQKVWPGEFGMAFVTDVETTVPWGQKLNTTVIETRTNLPSMGGITFART